MAASPFTVPQLADEIVNLLRTAILQKRAIAATYHGYRQRLCPHMLGWNQEGQLRLLSYQYGGESESGLQGEGLSNWRCIAPDQLQEVELRNDPWQTGERHSRRPTCIEHIELDSDQPERDPQKGQ